MPITSLEQLSEKLKLKDSEKNWKETGNTVPLCITDYYMSLIDPEDQNDPLRKQVVPTESENSRIDLESSDPLQEVEHSHGNRLIHRYNNRIAFLATDFCAQYCRHCFRRRFTGNMLGPATEEEVQECASYLKEHSEIREMLLTGGDPLTMSDHSIDRMIGIIREVSPKLIIRICTRIPVVLPSRISTDLISIFKKYSTAPFYLMTQFNHPRELTPSAIKAVAMFVDAGIPAMNQTVLLKGVNDNADTLEELCNSLLFNRIKPYYLFQGDLVEGTADFRVPLEKGMGIEHQLRQRLSGLAMPAYTADLPQGGGKVPLCGSYLEGKDERGWIFRTVEGSSRVYPDPEVQHR